MLQRFVRSTVRTLPRPYLMLELPCSRSADRDAAAAKLLDDRLAVLHKELHLPDQAAGGDQAAAPPGEPQLRSKLPLTDKEWARLLGNRAPYFRAGATSRNAASHLSCAASPG